MNYFITIISTLILLVSSSFIHASSINLTIEQKVAQLFLVQLTDPLINPSNSRLLSKYPIGGFVIIGNQFNNAKDLLLCTQTLQTFALKSHFSSYWIAIDQEGDSVSRIKQNITLFPPAMALGTIQSPILTQSVGSAVGSELKLLGVNLFLGPVLDINTNPQNPVIGVRSFGNHVDIVTKLSQSYRKGIEANNLLAVLKHFPGHGDTAIDSHLELPSINQTADHINLFTTIPFQHHINHQAKAIMTGHLLVPSIDPNYPASLSKVITTDWLKKRYQFRGLVITDDLNMSAIKKTFFLTSSLYKGFFSRS
ncbi:hypothetical protein DID75_02515 [Candidatus Marinamargulisbacteria bacterium SCGC AG-410-N11]|nr:hypothetical protein DID75_02515 [Candidatus Marinamargulisbacteria bacterium SCGC AG-410-N11]